MAPQSSAIECVFMCGGTMRKVQRLRLLHIPPRPPFTQRMETHALPPRLQLTKTPVSSLPTCVSSLRCVFRLFFVFCCVGRPIEVNSKAPKRIKWDGSMRFHALVSDIRKPQITAANLHPKNNKTCVSVTSHSHLSDSRNAGGGKFYSLWRRISSPLQNA